MADESNDDFLREIDELLQGGSENEIDTNHVDSSPPADHDLDDLKPNSTPPVEEEATVDAPPKPKTGCVRLCYTVLKKYKCA